MKQILLSIAVLMGCSLSCLSQDVSEIVFENTPADTVIQLTASKITLRMHGKGSDSKNKNGYYYGQAFEKKGDSLYPADIVITIDESEEFITCEGGNDGDIVQVSYIKESQE